MNRFGGWWPNVWAFVSGIGLGLMLCGIGHAETHTLTFDVDQMPGKRYEMWVKVRESGGGQSERCWVGTNHTRKEIPCNCEQRLETAMRAMKPYTENPLFRPDLHHMPTPEFIAYMEAWRTAAGLWDAVERDCWKKTP